MGTLRINLSQHNSRDCPLGFVSSGLFPANGNDRLEELGSYFCLPAAAIATGNRVLDHSSRTITRIDVPIDVPTCECRYLSADI
jgi:hypothetical protein